MARRGRFVGIPNAVRRKPLQASKFAAVLLSIVLGVAGFLRLIDARALLGDSLLGDGQFLALVLIPLVSLGLVVLVFVETLVGVYQVVRSDVAVADRVAARPGYVLLRGAEAIVAVVGVTVVAAAVPPLFADTTPAPAGVGIMLLLLLVGFGILFTSFVRAALELGFYARSA